MMAFLFEQEITAFVITLGVLLCSMVIGERVVQKFPTRQLMVSQLFYLLVGVVLACSPWWFKVSTYPIIIALLVLLVSVLNLRVQRFTCLLPVVHQNNQHNETIKHYGAVLLPFAFLVQLWLLWQHHVWIMQVAIMVRTLGIVVASFVSHSGGKKHIEHLTHTYKTVEGSVAFFLIALFILSAFLVVLQSLLVGALQTSLLLLMALALLLALIATAVDALCSRGTEAFFVPTALAYLLYILQDASDTVLLERFLLGGLFAGLLALFSIKVKFLTHSGAAATFLLGTTIFGIGGVVWTVPLLTFYLLSSLLSKLGKQRKAQFDLVFEKGSQRDAGQVYANGGMAWILMVVYSLNHDPAIFFAYLGTLAAVQADTWATEIGTMWPHPKAWLISTFQEVPVGTSGGISLPGTLGAFLGSLFVCASALLLQIEWLMQFGWLPSLLLIGFAGLLASLVDSFFGATVQAQYFDPIRQKVTERTHSIAPDGTEVENNRIKGIAFVNNDLVNTLCALSGAALAYGVIQNSHLFK